LLFVFIILNESGPHPAGGNPAGGTLRAAPASIQKLYRGNKTGSEKNFFTPCAFT
jgi:hypothetical protein